MLSVQNFIKISFCREKIAVCKQKTKLFVKKIRSKNKNEVCSY